MEACVNCNSSCYSIIGIYTFQEALKQRIKPHGRCFAPDMCHKNGSNGRIKVQEKMTGTGLCSSSQYGIYSGKLGANG